MEKTDKVDIELVVEARDGKFGCYITYLFHGADLGKAIALTLEDVKCLRVRGARVSSVQYYERSSGLQEWIRCPVRGLYRLETIHRWPIQKCDQDFVFPFGVIAASDQQTFDTDQIREAYLAGGEDGRRFIEVVVDGRRLYPVIRSLIKCLPAPHIFDIGLLSHWQETGVTEVWRADPSTSGNKISRYLKDNQLDILHNGYVDFCVRSRDKGYALWLSDHKIVTLFCATASGIKVMRPHVRHLGFSRRRHLRSIAEECDHFHYRLPRSLSRDRLTNKLRKDGFAKVKELRDD